MTRPWRFVRLGLRAIARTAALLGTALALGTVLAGCFLPPNLPPTIDAQVDPASGHAPLRVRLDASASTDPDGIIVGCHWTFEDGTTARGVNVEHTFTAPGTYVVDLTLRDDDGAEATTTIEVRVEPPNAAPTALFMVNPVAAVVGEPIRFDATVSQDPDGSVVAYAWDFGDGATAASPQADHAYATEGTYAVNLTVTDDDGATASATQFVLVAERGGAPVASFTPSSAAIDAGGHVQFDASASYAPGGEIVAYAWQFGDGGTATGRVAGHTYATAGTYTVALTVTDDLGATAIGSGTVYVGIDPPAGETITRSFWWTYGGANRTLQLSVPGDLYDWARAQSRDDWPRRDYDDCVLNPLDDPLMAEIAAALNLGSYRETVENALAFVQTAIAYQSDPGVFEYPRYPVETLVDEVGDCEDTAILYASLIRTLGHGALLVSVDTNGSGNANHMVVFVPIDETFPTCGMDCVWEYEGRLYAMAETAVDGGYYPLGQDPWGLEPGDIEQTWDVARIDIAPNMIKRMAKP